MNTVHPTVFVERLVEDHARLEDQFNRSFESLRLADAFEKAEAIFIKCNLTYPVYKAGVVTRKEYLERLIGALRRISRSTKIYVGEGEGGYNSFSISQAFKSVGFDELERKYPKVKIINLSDIPSAEVEILTLKGPYKLALPEIFFNEIDFSISCPVPKIHCMTKVTLSYKNQWGCVPDSMRLKNHYMFDFLISKVSEILKFKYAFLDGKFGLNLNGPIIGEPIEANWFVASNSLGAFDMIVSKMMGIDWRRVRHLRMADQYGFIPREEGIEIIGDPIKLQRKFRLKRNFWNYPALAAFHSRSLTHLFYFSRWAKPLHDVMYIFRKRPITE